MAIYETSKPKISSQCSGTMNHVVSLLLAAPWRVTRPVLRNHNYSVPSNNNHEKITGIQTTLSLAFWCIGLVLYFNREKVFSRLPPRGVEENTTLSVSDAANASLEFFRKIIRSVYNNTNISLLKSKGERSLTIVKRHGRCICGAIRFQVKVSENMKIEIGDNYQYTRIPGKAFRLLHGRNHLKQFQNNSNNNTIQFFCDTCGTHIMHGSNKTNATDLYMNIKCIKERIIINNNNTKNDNNKSKSNNKVNNNTEAKNTVVEPKKTDLKSAEPKSSEVVTTNNIEVVTETEKASQSHDNDKPSSDSLDPASQDDIEFVEATTGSSQPEFIVTEAASSISKSFGSNDSLDDKSEELEVSLYRLRKALSNSVQEVSSLLPADKVIETNHNEVDQDAVLTVPVPPVSRDF